LIIKEAAEENKMAEQNSMSKIELYRALTGYGRFDDHPDVSQFSGHPVSIDTSVTEEMDRALILVKRMERRYSADNPLAGYYEPCFKKIDEAFALGDSKKFKDSLQNLVDSIHME
jgi:hypothetical protein